jgi:hypothetical protein
MSTDYYPGTWSSQGTLAILKILLIRDWDVKEWQLIHISYIIRVKLKDLIQLECLDFGFRIFWSMGASSQSMIITFAGMYHQLTNQNALYGHLHWYEPMSLQYTRLEQYKGDRAMLDQKRHFSAIYKLQLWHTLTNLTFRSHNSDSLTTLTFSLSWL